MGTFYMREDGTASKANATGPATDATKCMSVATHNNNATFSAGDTIVLCDNGGAFTTRIDPPSSGSSGSGNIITYTNSGTPTLTVSDVWAYMVIQSKSYITIENLTFTGTGAPRGLAIQNASSYITVQDCTFQNMTNVTGYVLGVDAASGTASYIYLLDNTISNTGTGPSILISCEGPSYHASYILIQGNTCYDMCVGSSANTDGVWFGTSDGGCDHVICRNNTIYDHMNSGAGSPLDSGGHEVQWPQYYLIEGNDIYKGDGLTSNWKSTCNYYGIIRKNKFTDLYYYLYGPATGIPIDMAIYNNTQVGTGQIIYFENSASDSSYQTCHFKNNLVSTSGATLDGAYIRWISAGIYWNGNYFHNTNASASWTWGGEAYPWGATTAEFAEWESDYASTVSSNTLDKISATTDLFTNPTTRDYTLKVGSGAITAGVHLTTITSATGSGTQFTVDDASYFCDGYGLITGDVIMIGADKTQRTISAVNYSTNQITVTSSVNWTNGDTVDLIYYGSIPDAGAYQYNSGSETGTESTKLIWS